MCDNLPRFVINITKLDLAIHNEYPLGKSCYCFAIKEAHTEGERGYPMPITRTTPDPLRRFRLMAVRISMTIVMVCSALAYTFDSILAQGVLMGGIAGALGFWVIAIRLAKVAREKPSKVQYAALTWSFYRYALYGLVLYKAFALDRDEYHGLLGALIGIFIIRFVLMYLAISGRDQQPDQSDDEDEDGVDDGGESTLPAPVDKTDG